MKKFIFLIIAGLILITLFSFTTVYAKSNSKQQEKQTITKKENKKLLTPKKINVDDMKDLIARGADVNIRDKYKNTPLHLLTEPTFPYHVDSETIEKIKLLISAGADVNAQNNRGRTPLHGYEPGIIALQDPQIISILIRAGADPNIKAYGGNTVLDLLEKGVEVLNERIQKYSLKRDFKMVDFYMAELQKYEEQMVILKEECEIKDIQLLSEKNLMYIPIEYEKETNTVDPKITE